MVWKPYQPQTLFGIKLSQKVSSSQIEAVLFEWMHLNKKSAVFELGLRELVHSHIVIAYDLNFVCDRPGIWRYVFTTADLFNYKLLYAMYFYVARENSLWFSYYFWGSFGSF